VEKEEVEKSGSEKNKNAATRDGGERSQQCLRAASSWKNAAARDGGERSQQCLRAASTR
jgi:hypothetical protein